MLVPAHNLPQTAPNTITNNRAAKASACNKTGATQARILHRESPQHDEFALFAVAGLFYLIKF